MVVFLRFSHCQSISVYFSANFRDISSCLYKYTNTDTNKISQISKTSSIHSYAQSISLPGLYTIKIYMYIISYFSSPSCFLESFSSLFVFKFKSESRHHYFYEFSFKLRCVFDIFSSGWNSNSPIWIKI